MLEVAKGSLLLDHDGFKVLTGFKTNVSYIVIVKQCY